MGIEYICNHIIHRKYLSSFKMWQNILFSSIIYAAWIQMLDYIRSITIQHWSTQSLFHPVPFINNRNNLTRENLRSNNNVLWLSVFLLWRSDELCIHFTPRDKKVRDCKLEFIRVLPHTQRERQDHRGPPCRCTYSSNCVPDMTLSVLAWTTRGPAEEDSSRADHNSLSASIWGERVGVALGYMIMTLTRSLKV